MSNFDDFISVLPLETLRNTKITDNRVIIPSDVDADKLYELCKDAITQPSLSAEKALFIALQAKMQ